MSQAPRFRKIAAAFLLGALSAAGGSQAASRIESDDCRASEPSEDRIVTVGQRGEIRLASGASAVLADLHWPDDPALAGQASAWLRERVDRPLLVVRRSSVDRWGRTRIDAADGATDLAGSLVAAGLAQADAGESDALCRPELLAREPAPRDAGIGVWERPVREATDAAGLASAEGEFVVASGRVLAVGERPRRTYLNFTRIGEPGLSVTVTKRTWRIMAARGLTASALKGRLVRVRGRLEVWRGPVLDIASPDMIEVLDGEQAQRR